jgi:hypothetical protein
MDNPALGVNIVKGFQQTHQVHFHNLNRMPLSLQAGLEKRQSFSHWLKYQAKMGTIWPYDFEALIHELNIWYDFN